jgi:hypothetical protein
MTPGEATDGRPAVDPTKNVLDLVTAAVLRQDDLRKASDLLAEVRAAHANELRLIETARLDAIRAVDQGQIQRAAEVSAQQATTLAAQVATSAEAFRISLAASLEPIQKDIADLRRVQYEQAGQRAQVGESRLNIGAVLGGISVLLVLVFGIASLWLSAKG